MVEIREIDADGWQAMRDVRLAALQDAPYAFASTYEREAAFAEADWQRRATRGGSFLAYAPDLGRAPAGIAGGFEAGPDTIELVSMWVRPEARGHGIGRALVQAVIDWARARGAARVHLWVAENNRNARLLYERCGFRPTEERQPLPSNAEVTEVGMARSVHRWPMQSVYEAAGGSEGLLRLARAWHSRVMADEIVSHAFSHGFHPQHDARLGAYWAEALGGPSTYSDSYGDETSVVRIHSGNGPHEEMDHRAIACFDQALHDVGLGAAEPVRQVLHDYFAWATTTTMARYHDSADDVPEGLSIPHWSWDGLQH